MIEQRTGNVLDIERGIIVHGCNCQGVMGSGIAAEIKRRFPVVYSLYSYKHDVGDLNLGEIQAVTVGEGKVIVNAQTQDGFGTHQRQVNYEAVAQCFEKVDQLAKDLMSKYGVKLPILFPKIGAGLGGGNWMIISTIIDETVSDEFEKVLYVL